MKPIVICGPTASGKTELALELARQTGGPQGFRAFSREVHQIRYIAELGSASSTHAVVVSHPDAPRPKGGAERRGEGSRYELWGGTSFTNLQPRTLI